MKKVKVQEEHESLALEATGWVIVHASRMQPKGSKIMVEQAGGPLGTKRSQ